MQGIPSKIRLFKLLDTIVASAFTTRVTKVFYLEISFFFLHFWVSLSRNEVSRGNMIYAYNRASVVIAKALE